MQRGLEEFIEQMQEDSVRWFPLDQYDALMVYTLGLVGESGEVADIVKKFVRGSISAEECKATIAVELIDVFHYWCMLIGLFEIDVTAVYDKKREVNIARFESTS